jgi:hypothetical protein
MIIGLNTHIGKIAAKLKPAQELPDGVYLVTLEGEYMVEEDNENNFLIEEPTA